MPNMPVKKQGKFFRSIKVPNTALKEVWGEKKKWKTNHKGGREDNSSLLRVCLCVRVFRVCRVHRDQRENKIAIGKEKFPLSLSDYGSSLPCDDEKNLSHPVTFLALRIFSVVRGESCEEEKRKRNNDSVFMWCNNIKQPASQPAPCSV